MKSTQDRIQQSIKRFDICTLLKLLKELGYAWDDIYFESNPNWASYPSLCEDIVFSENFPKVRILLNFGLLSAHSPLPDFFRKKMDFELIDSILFTKFLNFFNHHMVKKVLLMSMPDRSDIFFSSWQATKGHYLKLLDFSSTSTLWHLFQACFPELKVKIIKSPKIYKQNSSSIVLGSTRLGVESFLGKKIVQTVPSFKFILVSEETHTELRKPWPIEIKERLKKFAFSLLQRTDMHFRVIFILKNNKDIAYLSRSTQLGYCMIGKSQDPLKLLLYAGHSKDLVRLKLA